MKLSRKTLIKGKKAFLKECSQDYWDIISINDEFNELGREWMWD